MWKQSTPSAVVTRIETGDFNDCAVITVYGSVSVQLSCNINIDGTVVNSLTYHATVEAAQAASDGIRDTVRRVCRELATVTATVTASDDAMEGRR